MGKVRETYKEVVTECGGSTREHGGGVRPVLGIVNDGVRELEGK